MDSQASTPVAAAVNETLCSIERRARNYRRLVQGFVFSAVTVIVFAAIFQLKLLLYLPSLFVLIFALWTVADSKELQRWQSRIAASGVSIGLLQLALRTREDVPRATVIAMCKSGLATESSVHLGTLSCLVLAAAFGCLALAIQIASFRWGLAGLFLSAACAAIRMLK